jgi:hypothetical protein
MNFDVAGPFKLNRYGNNKIVTKQSVKDVKATIETSEPGLLEACGCYVFAVGSTPFYVGQACKRSLIDEAMNASNLGKYNEILGTRKKGRPVLFLLPMKTPGGKFRKRSRGDGKIGSLDFLERWLIAAALERNSKLKNNKETSFLKKIHVTGIFNATQGGSTKPSRALNKALGR